MQAEHSLELQMPFIMHTMRSASMSGKQSHAAWSRCREVDFHVSNNAQVQQTVTDTLLTAGSSHSSWCQSWLVMSTPTGMPTAYAAFDVLSWRQHKLNNTTERQSPSSIAVRQHMDACLDHTWMIHPTCLSSPQISATGVSVLASRTVIYRDMRASLQLLCNG